MVSHIETREIIEAPFSGTGPGYPETGAAPLRS